MNLRVSSGETNLRQGSLGNTCNVKSFLLSERLLQSAAAQHLWKLCFVVVVGYASATLYSLIAMEPLGLAFMPTPPYVEQRERHKRNRIRYAKHDTFFYISSPSLLDYDVKLPNFIFVEDVNTRKRLPCSFSWTSIQSFRIQLQKKICELNEME